MKRFKLLLLFCVLIHGYMFASHVPGGSVTYECVGPNQYLVTLTLYEDCGTAFMSNADETIEVTNSCGFPAQTISLSNTMFQQNISQLCPSSMGDSECDGGTLPGIYMHQWQGIVTLPGACTDWTFAFDDCCRNASSNLVGSSSNYYFYALLNNDDAPCNNSPVVSAPPIPYACVNTPVCYSLGVVEVDGDSLVYSLVEALDGAGVPVSYQGGFSGAAPIAGVIIDPITGQVEFTATASGNYVFVIQVDEYDSNGNLIGTIIQDFTFEIVNCSNGVMNCQTSGLIGNVTGAVFQTGPNTLEMCEGASFQFDISFEDPDLGDSIFITSNIASVLPGAVVTTTYTNPPNANAMAMTVSWTPPPGSAGSNVFSVTVVDNSCPVSGSQTVVYNMDVIGSTNAGPDTIICLGQSAQLIADNGSVFNWTALSGDPIVVGTNFTCNPCATPQATPSVTTVYEVTSDLSGNCVNKDTMTVTVVPNFNYTLDQSAPGACLNEPVDITLTPTPGGAYTYDWSPATYLSSTTSPTPTMTPTTPGTYVYDVMVTSPDGCKKADSITIQVAAATVPDIDLIASATTLTCEDTLWLETDLGCATPTVSGLALNLFDCGGGAVDYDMGTNCGSNSSTTWPAPYGNWYRNAKHHFLFRATELQALGFSGGQITQISWEVLAINGTTTYNDYSIKMKGTATNDLTTTFEGGLVEVFSPQAVNIAVGWNTHVLTAPFEWNGTDNLLVEICYDNLADPYTNNSETPWDCPGFNASCYYRSDGTLACPNPTGTVAQERPITRFTVIQSSPDPADYSFTWTGGDVSAQAQNPFAIPMADTTFQVVVEHIVGGCTDTASVSVSVNCDTCHAPTPDLTHISCNGGADGKIIATGVGQTGPWTFDFFDNIGTLLYTVGPTTIDSLVDLPAGTYRIMTTDTSGCMADTTVELTQPDSLLIALSGDTTICIGGTASISASATGGSPQYTFNWQTLAGNGPHDVTPVISETYTVSVTDSMGCFTSDTTFNVYVLPPMTTSNPTTGPDQVDSICQGFQGEVGIDVTGGDGGPYAYTWVDANANPVGVGSSVTVTPTTSPAWYYVAITDGCETPAAIDSAVVYWYDQPVADFTADIFADCYPVEVTFTNLTDPTLSDLCTWDFGDGNTIQDCGPVTNTYTDPGLYTVSLNVMSPDGCFDDTTKVDFIEAYDHPVAFWTANPNPTDILSPTVQFTNQSSADVTSYTWTFGVGNVLGTDFVENPEFTFPDDAGAIYLVDLYVTNQYGCDSNYTDSIIINDAFTFYVPNAFSPDGDGVNETFGPKGERISADGFLFMIFDRWGDILYQTNNKSDQWDGTVNGGDPAKSDVYVWKIEAINEVDGSYIERTGHVTLIR